MLKKTVEILFFGGSVPLGVLMIYSFVSLFSVDSNEGFYRMVAMIMILILLFGVLLVLFLFRFNFSKKPARDRVRSLPGKKVFSVHGDFVGNVGDVLLGENAIYGLKILVKTDKIKNKKIIIKRANIRNYSDVILVDNDVVEKFV